MDVENEIDLSDCSAPANETAGPTVAAERLIAVPPTTLPREPEDDGGDIETLSAQARAASAVSPSESLRMAERAQEMAESLGTARARAYACWARAAALRALAQSEEALAAFLEGARQAEIAGDPLLAARVPMGATETLAQLGRYDDALLLSNRLETDLQSLGAVEDVAKVVANAGNVHFQRKAYVEALDCWQRALTFFEARGEQIRAARLQMNVASVLTCLHRLPEAMQMYEAARSILESAGMDLLVAGLEGDLGYVRFMAGRHYEALQTYARARRRFESLNLPKDVAQCDRETADIYLELNLIPEARNAYERVQPLFQGRQMAAESARSDLGLAATLFRQGYYDDAFAALDRAERTFRQEGNRVGAARVRLRRADFQYRSATGSATPPQNRAAVQGALRVFQRNGMLLETAHCQLLRAEMRIDQGVSPGRSFQRLAKSAESGSFPTLRWRIEAARGRAAIRAGDRKMALQRYRHSIDAVERMRRILQGNDFRVAFFDDKAAIYEEAQRLLLDEELPVCQEEAFELLELARARTLLDSMSAPRTGASAAETAECAALRQRLDDLRTLLNWHYAAAEQTDADAGRHPIPAQITAEAVPALEKEYLEVHHRLTVANGSSSGPAASTFGIATLSELSALLADDEQVVAYATVQDEILAYVIGRDGYSLVRGLASRTEIERSVERLRFQWNKMTMRAYVREDDSQRLESADRILRDLYRRLVEPLEPLLPGQRLTIAPHGVLHNVPFPALHDGDGYLIDRREIAYTPSCSVWKLCRQREEPNGGDSLIYGVPEEGIACTREELADLRQVVPDATFFEGEAATTSALPRNGVFRYLHFATHAVFRKDNPFFSALRMNDGWLFAHELYERRLECSLVTLSACHTGASRVSPGDETLGLVYGFLHAGARAVLVSLWAADDAATALLMKECYTAMAGGAGRAAALRTAAQKVRERWTHPYYWAPFALIGAR